MVDKVDKDGQSVSFDFQGIIILESEGYWRRVTMAQSRVKKSTTGSPARGIETWQTPQSTRRWSIAGPGHQTAFEKLSLPSQGVHHGHLVISVLIKPGLDLNWNFSRLPWIAPQREFQCAIRNRQLYVGGLTPPETLATRILGRCAGASRIWNGFLEVKLISIW